MTNPINHGVLLGRVRLITHVTVTESKADRYFERLASPNSHCDSHRESQQEGLNHLTSYPLIPLICSASASLIAASAHTVAGTNAWYGDTAVSVGKHALLSTKRPI
jgi:hypothetical protein